MGVTANTHLVVGSDDFCLLLDNDMRDHTVNSSVPSQSEIIAAGVEHYERLPHTVSSEISVGALYYSDLSKSLGSDRDSALAFVIWDGYVDEFGRAPAVWEGGLSFLEGLPQTAPSTDAITNALTVRPTRKPWSRGSKAHPFRLAQGSLSFSIPGTFTNEESAFLVVTEKPSSTSRTLTLTASSKTVTQSVTGPSAHELDLSGLDGGALSSATLSTTGLTGNSVVAGWLLIGSEYERPA